MSARFFFNTLGGSGGTTLQLVADLDVTLLLFTIGLKLKLNTLFKPEVWFGTTCIYKAPLFFPVACSLPPSKVVSTCSPIWS